MKKIMSLLLILSLILSPEAFAMKYLETTPEAIRVLNSNGLGATYKFQRPDSGVQVMRVTKLTPSSDGKSLLVEVEQADNKILLNFDGEDRFAFETAEPESIETGAPASSSTESEPTEQSPAKAASTSRSGGLGVGVGSGVMAAAQVGIILSSGYLQQIEKAYARIAQLQAQMGLDFERIEKASFDLRTQLFAVSLRATQSRPNAQLLEVKLTAGRAEIKALADQSSLPAAQIQFVSHDQRFLNSAEAIQKTLSSAKIKDTLDQTFYNISKESLVLADQRSFLGQSDEAEMLLGVAQTAADVLVGLDPFTGTARGLFEVITGENMITGAALSDGERALAVLGVLTAGYAIKSYVGFKLIQKLAVKIAPHAEQGLALAKKILASANQLLKPQVSNKITRTVNLLSKTDSSWGLTPRHLNKHFSGNSKYALRNIDPKGNTSVWLNHISDLLQRPATRKLKDGVFEVQGVFQKADGSGPFDLGVRLFQNADGSYDLVTILTRQPK